MEPKSVAMTHLSGPTFSMICFTSVRSHTGLLKCGMALYRNRANICTHLADFHHLVDRHAVDIPLGMSQ